MGKKTIKKKLLEFYEKIDKAYKQRIIKKELLELHTKLDKAYKTYIGIGDLIARTEKILDIIEEQEEYLDTVERVKAYALEESRVLKEVQLYRQKIKALDMLLSEK